MTKTTYYKVELNKDFLKATYNSEDGKCKLTYDAVKALDKHPLSEMYNASITFRKSDVQPIIDILTVLQGEVEEEK